MRSIKGYIQSFGAGLVAGALYFFLHMPSPAPPWPALVGLMGILAGERVGGGVVTRLRARRSHGFVPSPNAEKGDRETRSLTPLPLEWQETSTSARIGKEEV
ncbi:DUF1427 family protein [Arthrobacter sp. MI7-26]|uniref:DUF1427 family protein n=1 Tax=Arthrobacter sp. MI7-26 TaxID=2993653 RepID=UPI003A599A52